jgi:hypothetical protein
MRYLCVHGHFCQPPRENPSLEAVELQDSAYPYHDWNDKINSECYAPNTTSRILDEEQRIIQLANNYSQISFNFRLRCGKFRIPVTLLSSKRWKTYIRKQTKAIRRPAPL